MLKRRNPAEHLAFLLNGYNAICIKIVADALRSGELAADDSIRDLGSNLSPIWKRPVGLLAGKNVSLDQIEHGHVRSIFKDARVHGCLNCASVSCPDLPDAAFEARNLNKTMDERISKWVDNPTKGVGRADNANTVLLSMIFRCGQRQ